MIHDISLQLKFCIIYLKVIFYKFIIISTILSNTILCKEYFFYFHFTVSQITQKIQFKHIILNPVLPGLYMIKSPGERA